jgi:hypothetical protein
VRQDWGAGGPHRGLDAARRRHEAIAEQSPGRTGWALLKFFEMEARFPGDGP